MQQFAVTGWLIALVSLPIAIFALAKLRTYEGRAITESLTGLYNQRWLWDSLDRIIGRLSRSGQGVAVIFIDLDGFKSINDNNGHLVGDAVLSAVAKTLKNSVRPTDYCVRYGGDEFVIILPDTELVEGCSVAKQVLAALEYIPLRELGVMSGHISASGGVADTAEGYLTAHDLVEKADHRAYLSKLSGKGRITCDDKGEERL